MKRGRGWLSSEFIIVTHGEIWMGEGKWKMEKKGIQDKNGLHTKLIKLELKMTQCAWSVREYESGIGVCFEKYLYDILNSMSGVDAEGGRKGKWVKKESLTICMGWGLRVNRFFGFPRTRSPYSLWLVYALPHIPTLKLHEVTCRGNRLGLKKKTEKVKKSERKK